MLRTEAIARRFVTLNLLPSNPVECNCKPCRPSLVRAWRPADRSADECVLIFDPIIPIERLIESRGEEIPEAMINALGEKSIAFGK